jgi:hypothetical protein
LRYPVEQRGLVRVSSVRRDLRADRQGVGHRDINPFGLAENAWADHAFGPADELTIYLGLRDLGLWPVSRWPVIPPSGTA